MYTEEKFEVLSERITVLEAAYSASIQGVRVDIEELYNRGNANSAGDLGTLALFGTGFAGLGANAGGAGPGLKYPMQTPAKTPATQVSSGNVAALNAVMLAATAAGASAPTAGSVTKGAAVDTGTATLYSYATNERHITRSHRLRLSPAGTPTTGLCVTVVFPQPIAGAPVIKLTNEGQSQAPNFYLTPTMSGNSCLGYTITCTTAPSGSLVYTLAVEVSPPVE